MKETDFGRKFIEHFKTKFPYAYGFKVHGHEMQQSFIPDFLYCVNGLFLGIEFKVQRDGRISITPGQAKELNKIQNAKGIALLVAFDEDKKKIYIRQKRIDYMILLQTPVKSKNIRLDWDFEFSTYEDAVDLISVMVAT